MSEIHTPTPSQPSLTWALIGQAYAPVSIPPKGYGAVESIIWDYKTYLQQLGHKVVVINTADKREIIDAVNRCRPDVVHLHQYPLSGVLNKIRAPVKIFTSHSGHEISQLACYRLIAKHFMPYLKDGLFIFVLSPVWRQAFIDCGYHPAEVFVALNGADHRRFQFRKTPLHANRGIYLGNITGIKRQHLYQTIDSLDFVGPHGNAKFDQTRANYLGEWTREYLYAHLSDYANLVILSRVEAAAPLVVLEALVCGLGVVVSEAASVNLDTKLPWVTVIPEQKITDIDFVAGEIARNRAISLRHREAIRQYGIDNFSWEKLIPRYAGLCLKLRAESAHNRPPPPPQKLRNTLRRLRYLLPALPGGFALIAGYLIFKWLPRRMRRWFS